VGRRRIIIAVSFAARGCGIMLRREQGHCNQAKVFRYGCALLLFPESVADC